MPTGYTNRIQNGEITEFKDFALACARAFGALISMRDDALDAPMPAEILPDTKYHDDHIAAATLEIDDSRADFCGQYSRPRRRRSALEEETGGYCPFERTI